MWRAPQRRVRPATGGEECGTCHETGETSDKAGDGNSEAKYGIRAEAIKTCALNH